MAVVSGKRGQAESEGVYEGMMCRLYSGNRLKSFAVFIILKKYIL